MRAKRTAITSPGNQAIYSGEAATRLPSRGDTPGERNTTPTAIPLSHSRADRARLMAGRSSSAAGVKIAQRMPGEVCISRFCLCVCKRVERHRREGRHRNDLFTFRCFLFVAPRHQLLLSPTNAFWTRRARLQYLFLVSHAASAFKCVSGFLDSCAVVHHSFHSCVARGAIAKKLNATRAQSPSRNRISTPCLPLLRLFVTSKRDAMHLKG